MAKQKEAWDKLSMQEKALLIKLSVENGVSSLKLIRDTYNLYSSGGKKQSTISRPRDIDEAIEVSRNTPYNKNIDDVEGPGYREYMWKLAQAKSKVWGISPEEAYDSFIHPSEFNYRRWYNLASQDELDNTLTNGDAHWMDVFGKTVGADTFSNESPYSGYANPYNPKGITGGTWTGRLGIDEYIPSESQIDNNWPLNKAWFAIDRGNRYYQEKISKGEDTHEVPSIMTYNNGVMLPEITVTPRGNYIEYYPYANGGDLAHKKSGAELGESSWLNNGYKSSNDWLLLMKMNANQMLQNLLNSPFYMTDLEMLNLEVARIKEAMAQSPTSEMVSYPWVNEQGDEIIKTIPVGQRDKMELGLSDPLLLGLGLGKAITNGVLPVMYNQGVKLASKLTPYLDMASPGTASFMQNVWNAGKAGKALGIGLTGLESYNIADAILNYRYNPNAQTGVQAGLSLLPFVDGAQFIKPNIQNPFKIINTDDVYEAMADAMSPFTTSNIVWTDRNFWSPKGTRSAQIPEYARLGLPKGSKVPHTEAENIAFRQQVNDFAAKYGYLPIGDEVTDPEVLERYARSLIKRHNTFFRGVTENPDFPDLSLEYMATHAYTPEDPLYISPFESVARSYGHPVEILRPYHLGEDRTKWFTEGEFPIYTSGGRGSLDDWKDKSAIAAPWISSETLKEVLRTGRVLTPDVESIELTGRNLPFIPMRIRKGTRSASLDVLNSIDTSFEGSRAVPNTPFYTITDQLLEYLNKYGTRDTNSDAVSYAFEHGLLSPEAMVTYKQLLDGGVDINLLRANQVEELAHLYTSKEGLPFTIDNFKLLHTGLGDFVVPPLVTMMPSTAPLSFENYTIPQRSSGVINPNSPLYTTNDGIYDQRLYNVFKQLAKTLDIPQAEFEQFATKPFIHAFKQYYYNKGHHVGDLTDTEIAKIIAYNYRLLTVNLTGMLKDQILWNGSGRVIDNQGNIVRSESPDDFTIQMDWLQGGNSDKLGVWFGPYEEAASYGYPRNLDTREFFRGLSDAEHFDVQPYLISNVEGVLSNPTSSWLHFPNKHSQYGWNPMLPSNTVYTGSALVGELVTSDLRHIKGLFPHPQLILQGGSQRSWDVPGLHYSDGGNLAHKKSTGGPLYPFSFEKNPFLKTPVVRYDEGGEMVNINLPEVTVFPEETYITYTGNESKSFIPTKEEYNEFKANEIRRQALVNMNNRNTPNVPYINNDPAKPGNSCLYTFLSNYPVPLEKSNRVFWELSPEESGFKRVDTALPGDGIQVFSKPQPHRWGSYFWPATHLGVKLKHGYRFPSHMTMFKDINTNGVLIRGSNGSTNPIDTSAIVEERKPISYIHPYNADIYRFVGTKKLQKAWEKEYNNIYKHGNN